MRARRRWLGAVSIAVGLTAGLAVNVGLAGSAAAAPVGPVATTAAAGTPALAKSDLNQQLRQIVQCGPNMYAVGTITAVTQKGATYTRNNIFSFSAVAPYTMTSWAPNVNGVVNSIAFNGTDCSQAYIGGTFSSVNGTSVANLAKISTSSGAVDPSFKHQASGQVSTLLGVAGGHILVGGYFKSINNSDRAYYASLNATTGTDDGYLDLNISGNYQFPGVGSNPSRVFNQQLSHSGDKVLVEGDFTSVGGLHREQIFALDLGATSGTVDSWNSNEFYGSCATVEPFYLQAAAWSPDDTNVYVSTTGYHPYNMPTGSFPRTGLCDAVAAFPFNAASTVTHTWVNYAGCDSFFSIAADASTVYAGGHERWASNPRGCDFAGPGAIAAPGMVGLSPTTGAVTWNPGRGRGLGADDMEVTATGLWIASDNMNNTNMCAGSSGHQGICFLPYPGVTTHPPTAKVTVTCPSGTLSCSFDASGSTDDGTITAYSWDFGDGHTQTTSGPTVNHPYDHAATYSATVTVTDDQGLTGSATVNATPSAPSTSQIAFDASNSATTTKGTNSTVTVPNGVHSGDVMVLVESATGGVTNAAPSGWTLAGTKVLGTAITTNVYTRTATGADPGTPVSFTFSASTKSALTLAAYSGVDPTNPIGVIASATDSATATHVTPTATIGGSGSWALSYWADKSATTPTSWTTPGTVTAREKAIPAQSTGAVAAQLADSAAVESGTYGNLAATVNTTSTKGLTMTIGLNAG